jgi:serine/threonine-protein kinase
VDSSQAQLQQALGDAYLIERELGGGGMSRVFVAVEASLKRRVAIKLLPPEQASSVSAARFKQEIELTAHLQHPHVLPILAAGARDDLLYYVMPYVEGESLRHRLTRECPLPLSDAVRVLQEIADALEYAHLRGVVHRDIKPENILLEGDHAVLTDFGVARAIATAQSTGRFTDTGLSVGTPGYMAPEQASGERHVDARADIYALAVVGYEMLAGVPPFSGPTAQAILAAHLRDLPPDLHTVRPEVPAGLAAAITRALAKDPAARFQSAAAFRDAVVASAGPLAAWPRTRIPAILGIAAALVVALGSGTMWYWRTHRLPPVDRNLVAIAPFEVLDDQLSLWHEGMVDVLARNLDGAGPLRTVAPTMVIRRWSGRSDRRSAVALGRATGAGLAVFGSIQASGPDSVHVSATLVNVSTGRSLGDVDARDAATHIDRLCDSLTVGLLRELGRVRTITATLGGSLGSSSLPAIKAYLQGEQWFRVSNWDSAGVYYDRAIGLDSSFALAWATSGLVHGWLGGLRDQQSLAYGLHAGRLNHGLAPRDSMMIVADSLMSAIASPNDTLAWTHLERLFATVDAADRRYPTDPDVWYFTGEVREHLGVYPGHYFTSVQIIDAFDRSIAADSQFAPAYIHPIEQSLALGDTALALRYIRAYLALDPTDAEAGAIRLVRTLIDSESTSAARDSALRAASYQELFEARGALFQWPDSAERDIEALRIMNKPGHQPPGSRGDSLGLRIQLAGSLAARGHVDRARAAAGMAPPAVVLFNASLVGVLPRDSVNASATALLAQRSPQLAYAVPWWAYTRDTSSLRAAASALRALLRTGLSLRDVNEAALGAREVPAYLALARNDTVAALRQLDAIPDSLCMFADCTPIWATRSHLLAAAKRWADALRILPPRNVTFGSLLAVPIELQRAHLLESLGRRAEALESYIWVTETWRAPDPVLVPFVTEARAGVRRLSGELAGRTRMLGTGN